MSKIKFKISVLSVFIAIILILMMNEAFNNINNSCFQKTSHMLIYCAILQWNKVNFLETIIMSFIYLLFDGIFTFMSNYDNNKQTFLITIGLVFWMLVLKHMKLKMEIDLFNKERVLDYEKTRLKQLIRYLLPPHVKLVLNF